MKCRYALGALILAASAQMAAARSPCPPQPLPPALDSIAALPETRSAVEFSATPSLDYPGLAWVIRLSRSGYGAGTLEIVRLRRQADCNRYDVEKRWQASLPAEEYRAVVEAAAALGTPPADAFSHNDSMRALEGLALDGTGITLRMRTTGWEVRRQLNHYGRGGAALSAIFHALVSKHVPAAEIPADDWRTRRSE